MTIHYHGTPITPRVELLRLGGRNFCVSFAHPRDVEACHQIGQSVMLDNGAFSFWRKSTGVATYLIIPEENAPRHFNVTEMYNHYAAWCEQWTSYRTTWCVIPDIIGVDDPGLCAEYNMQLINAWPKKSIPIWQSAPVWHMHEPIDRLKWFVDRWPRVCIGSSGRFSTPGSDIWHRRMDTAFNVVSDSAGRVFCQLHMLRGMKLCQSYYPFSSVDSTDVAQNHKTTGDIVAHADRWDVVQCKSLWHQKMEQHEAVLP